MLDSSAAVKILVIFVIADIVHVNECYVMYLPSLKSPGSYVYRLLLILSDFTWLSPYIFHFSKGILVIHGFITVNSGPT